MRSLFYDNLKLELGKYIIKMLDALLKTKKCFKLVCGAGNEDAVEVEKLVALYSTAGCNFFDLCARPEIVDAAKRGLKFAEQHGVNESRYLCVSVGIQGDPHVSKACINNNVCKNCGACKKVCLQNAIICDADGYKVNKIRCIGCRKCIGACNYSAVDITSEFRDLKEVLPPLIEKGIDCIELHALGQDENDVDLKWQDINNCFDGILSICIDRSKLSNEKLLERAKRLLKLRKPDTTIIQADGAPMTGGEDDYKTTLQTIATAEIFQDQNLPVYILLSGGTNSKSTELARQCGIDAHGVAIGTYARKIVREYIDREDFFTNKEVFNNALILAKNLVDVSLKFMG